MATYKVDKSPNEESINETRDVLKTKGAEGAHQKEPIPHRNQTPREMVMTHRNAWIVLGGDRMGSIKSGEAGMGSTQSAAMDLVVGMGQNEDGQPPDNDEYIDPNPFRDASRVYLTQKGDIDTYFGIAKGVFGDFMSTEKKSGAVMKADHVRLVAREGIKLVTGKGKNSEGTGEKNSLGQEAAKVPPIEFIAGNYTDQVSNPPILQPLAKGDNLVEYLLDLQSWLQKFMAMVQANTLNIAMAHSTLGGLTAPVPPLSAIHVTTAAVAIKRQTTFISEQQNLISLQMNYLRPIGETYINSNHVYTT